MDFFLGDGSKQLAEILVTGFGGLFAFGGGMPQAFQEHVDVLAHQPLPAVLTPVEYACFARLVRASFAHKRKTLFNSLVLSGWDKERVTDALARAGLAPAARAEEISLEKFLEIHRLLS